MTLIAEPPVYESPAATLCSELSELLRPRERVDRPFWCEQHLRLPPETSAEATRFDLTRHPWVRAWLEAMDDPITRIVTIMGGTQIGKTTFEQAALASCAILSPAPAMLAGPDRGFVRELRDKVYRMAEESEPLKGLIPPPARRNDRWIDLGTMICYLAWAGNTQRLSGKACKRVLCTEIDRWRNPPRYGNTAKIVAERVKAYMRSLIVYEGNPTDELGAIFMFWDESDRRRFCVPCPTCNHYQELRFFPHKEGKFAGCGGIGGLTDAKGDFLPVDEVRQSAYYICEQGCTITTDQKWDCIPHGIWAPEGQRVKNGKLTGKPKRSARHAGFHISSLYSLVLSFGDVAAEYLRAREQTEDLKVWWNNWLGLPFSVQTKMPKWSEIGRRLAGYHTRGFVPQPALFLTAGVDVQEDAVYWVVRAWGEGGTSWLVDWGRINQRIGADGIPIADSDLAELDQALFLRTFPLVQPNPVGRVELQIRMIGIDVNYRAHSVHRWAKSHPGDRVRCVAGVAGLVDLWQRSTIERSARDGKPYEGGLVRWGLNTDVFKSDLQSRWAVDQGQPGGWWLCKDVLTIGETYLRQIVNEAPVMKRNKAGHKVRMWEVVDKRTGNHYWDDEVYARAMAEMVTGGEWDNLVSRAGGSNRRARPTVEHTANGPDPR